MKTQGKLACLKSAGGMTLGLMILAAISGWAKDASWDARLTAVSGEVTLTPSGGEAVSAEAGVPIEDGDRVTTGTGASAEISLDGESLISLGENSDFTMRASTKKASKFELTLGSLLAKIKKLGRGDMTVLTPTAVIAVRGTEFAVDIDGEQSRVGVFDEGKVEVRGEDGSGTQTLTSNQETFIPRGGPPRGPQPLQIFAQRREAMRDHSRRLQEVRRDWQHLPSSDRRAARQNFLERGGRNGRTPGNGQDRRGPGQDNQRGGPGQGNDRLGPGRDDFRRGPGPDNNPGGPRPNGPRGNDEGRRGPPPGGNDGGRRRPPPGGGRP